MERRLDQAVGDGASQGARRVVVGRAWCVWVVFGVLNVGGPNRGGWGLDLIVVPAVTYSPTPSRVQYHRRCGS